MILLFAALAAAAPPSSVTPATNNQCASLGRSETFSCRATSLSAAGNFAEAAAAFEHAADVLRLQESADSPVRASQAFAAAGNMWIAAGHPAKASIALDKALGAKNLEPVQHGLAVLDRARAAEAQGDLKTARAKVTEASKTIAEDPYLWFFSAALAVREDDIPTAKSAINRALALAPDSPEVMFEAGHVAKAAGEDAKARDYWTSAAAADPKGPAGRAARGALALMEVPLTVTNQVATRPNGDGEGPKDEDIKP